MKVAERIVCDFCGQELERSVAIDAGYDGENVILQFDTHCCARCFYLVRKMAIEGQLRGIEALEGHPEYAY